MFIFLLLSCKKEDTSGVSDSIYGTYSKAEGGQSCGSSGCTPNLGTTTLKVVPIDVTYFKLSGNGGDYDSVRLNANRSFSFEKQGPGYHLYGSGSFGSKTISVEVRNSSSVLLHKYDNVPKVSDSY